MTIVHAALNTPTYSSANTLLWAPPDKPFHLLLLRQFLPTVVRNTVTHPPPVIKIIIHLTLNPRHRNVLVTLKGAGAL